MVRGRATRTCGWLSAGSCAAPNEARWWVGEGKAGRPWLRDQQYGFRMGQLKGLPVAGPGTENDAGGSLGRLDSGLAVRVGRDCRSGGGHRSERNQQAGGGACNLLQHV